MTLSSYVLDWFRHYICPGVGLEIDFNVKLQTWKLSKSFNLQIQLQELWEEEMSENGRGELKLTILPRVK